MDNKEPKIDGLEYSNPCDGDIHVVPIHGAIEHIESKYCWCCPYLAQGIDDEHDKQVFVHKGYEELNQ